MNALYEDQENTLLTMENSPVFAPDEIPEVPRYEILKAQGGELNFKLDPKCSAAKIDISSDPDWWIGFKKIAEVIPYPAKPGDILVEPNLRIKVSVEKNLEHRILVQERCRNDVKQQQIQEELCRSSILYWFNTFVWTKDPRLDIKVIPFVTYPFQDLLITRILWAIKNKKVKLIEKSREMGATWVVEGVAVYMAKYYPDSSNYQFSLNETDVDDYTENSLLGKGRFILNRLPVWMRGGWVERRSGVDKTMLIRLPETGSIIFGKLTGGTAGVGGRATSATYDEFAVLGQKDPGRDRATMQAAASLSDSQIILSTPRGSNNEFAKLAKHPSIEKSTLHWSEHPLKTPAWAIVERAKAIYNDERWASEQEISYEVSTQGRVYPEFVSRSFSKEKWSHIQRGKFYEHDPGYDVIAAIDFGVADPTVILFAQVKPAPLHFETQVDQCLVVFDMESAPNKRRDYWIQRLKRRIEEYDYRYSHYIADMRSAVQRDDNLIERRQHYAEAGIRLVGHRRRTAIEPIDIVRGRLELPGAVAVNQRTCYELIQGFQNWAWVIDPLTGLPMRREDPEHDENSHCMKAYAYLADWLYGKKKSSSSDDYRNSKEWNFKVLS